MLGLEYCPQICKHNDLYSQGLCTWGQKEVFDTQTD